LDLPENRYCTPLDGHAPLPARNVISLAKLNALPTQEFICKLAGIFEHSPWVAQRVVAARPFDSIQHLLEAMRTAVEKATPEEQLVLIRAHPRLKVSGRAREELTAASSSEQRGAGLDACAPAEAARLDELNAAYIERFSMPFILAVRGHTPASIIAACEERLANDAVSEQRAALREIGLIAGYRLADLVSDASDRNYIVDPTRYVDLIRRHINVADARLGAVALSATDEFFAPMARMLNPSEPEWRAGVYDAHGKWMDGWETRRRRDQGHDYCIVRLAGPATLALLEIDTRYFTGNYPPLASVQACSVAAGPDDHTQWTDLLPSSALKGDQRNFFELQSQGTWTHLKLNIFPDGGIARLRAYGTLQRDWTRVAGAEAIDLAAALNGGRALACSDEHYGAMGNLLLPGRGASMADGWETRRRRGPGFDWVIVRLGTSGRIQCVEVDTAYFKGNYPHQISINAAQVQGSAEANLTSECLSWPVLLEPQLLQADTVVQFRKQVRDLGSVSHARVNMHPDGGLSRVRLFGPPDRGGG
jgi:allantoicase